MRYIVHEGHQMILKCKAWITTEIKASWRRIQKGPWEHPKRWSTNWSMTERQVQIGDNGNKEIPSHKWRAIKKIVRGQCYSLLITKQAVQLVCLRCKITQITVPHNNYQLYTVLQYTNDINWFSVLPSRFTGRLEYIMLLKLPIILSSNSFIFHLLFSKLFPGW